ncbi:MAG: BON domain-containing protein [Trichodesmium sp. MO_231.B1]|nr:BON domain-containing protein [Trichodesmium sp. MO_231.B1]
MKNLTSLLLGSILLLGAVGCETARTSADAPGNLNDQTENINTVEETLEDANSEIRQAQLDADIRAREQRNKVFGNEQERADTDIISEVRAKLEANIPRSKLVVTAEDGKVNIAGTVTNQKEYETIEPLAKEIKGVEAVSMDVKIVSPEQS